MSAGLVLAATSANAQISAPYDTRPLYSAVSDFDGPYAAMPPEGPAPGYYGPRLLPAPEVYTVLRDNGFSPLGPPQQRGMFYIIAVLGRGGEGRLVIDARDGRIVRFVPGYRTGGNFNADVAVAYGPPGSRPVSAVRGPPRPPASVPYVARRTPAVPLPRTMPRHFDEPPVAARPTEPAPQSMAMEAKPAAAAPPPASPPAVIEARPAPQIQPTKEMPKVQDLE
jgi:hypothetical protein